MDIKLKTLTTNNPKFKVLYLFMLFLCISILFEVCFNLTYSFRNSYGDSYLSFYLFGQVKRASSDTIFRNQVIIAVIAASLSIIFFLLYKQTKYITVKSVDFIIDLTSKFSLESLCIFIGLLFFIRFIIWDNTLSFYDNGLITLDFIILLYCYFSYKSFTINNIKNRIPYLTSFKHMFNKSDKISNKMLSYILIAFIMQFIILTVFISKIMGFLAGGVFISILLSSITSIFYIHMYMVYYNKFIYISYISESLTIIENGDFDYKLDLEGDDELYNIATSINNITSGLESALEEKLKSEKFKTELITNVSHDLKTPLTSIVSYIDILKNNELDENTTKDYLNILDRKAIRLKTLVEDIFEASKINSGDIELNFEKTDIKELLIQSIVELEDKIEKSNLDFIINTPDSPLLCNIDGKRTFRVFENLINNITKYSLMGTRVYIDINKVDDYILITMKNISSYKLNITSDKLLERFVRGDVSRNTDGSGLGLSISKNLVELQGGYFDLNVDGDLFKVSIKFKAIN